MEKTRDRQLLGRPTVA